MLATVFSSINGIMLMAGLSVFLVTMAIAQSLYTARQTLPYRRRLRRISYLSKPSDAAARSLRVRLERGDIDASFIEKIIVSFFPSKNLLQHRLELAGLKLKPSRFLTFCLLIFILISLVFLLRFPGNHLLAYMSSFLLTMCGSYGYLSILISRRRNKFLMQFPDAIDIMARALRSGLALMDSLRIAGQETPEPVGQSLLRVIDAVQLGSELEDELNKEAARFDIQEFRFFAIAIAIQREVGGNIVDTLCILSEVLRKRLQLKLKVRALSSEAKASAIIIGSLPFLIALAIYFLNNSYIKILFEDRRGNILLAGGLVWFSLGIIAMARMIKIKY